MNEELYQRLLTAYSDKNLNKITGTIIKLYQNKNFGQLRKLAACVFGDETVLKESDTKCFSKLIMLYHPDKGEVYRNQFGKYYSEKNYSRLNEFSHIFQLEGLDKLIIDEYIKAVDDESFSEWADATESFDYFKEPVGKNFYKSDSELDEYEDRLYESDGFEEYYS
jgi:hypothetical protein